MTISNEVFKVIGLGNDVATVFSFSPMVIQAADQLTVILTSVAGAETTIAEGEGPSNYKVNVSSYPGTGSITYPASGSANVLATGERITVKRELPFTQKVNLVNQGGYFPDVQEAALDRGVMLSLQLSEELGRTIKSAVSDDTADLTLPTVTERKGKFLAFNSDGEPIASTSAIDTTALSSFVETIVDDADAAEVMTTLGISSDAQDFLTAANDAAMLAELGAISVTDNPEFVNTDDDATLGPELSLYRDSDSPASNDSTGAVVFKANNDADAKTTFARISTQLRDVTDGSEDARLQLYVMKNGSLTSVVDVDERGLFVDDEQLHPIQAGLSTAQASTSGTTVDFTDIRDDAQRITINFMGVSVDGSENLLLQIGDSGGLETDGYVSSAIEMSANDSNSATTSAAGFLLTSSPNAAREYNGTAVLSLTDATTKTWTMSGLFTTSANGYMFCGTKSLSGTLDRLTVTTTGTPDDFDKGSISIRVE